MDLRSIFLRESQYPKNVVKSLFKLRLPEGSQGTPPLPQNPRAFRDPAGPYLLQMIGGELRRVGHVVNDPRGSGGSDAICDVVRGDFEYRISLGLWREEGFLNCILSTGHRPVPWYSKRPVLNIPAWASASDDVARVLEQLFGRDSIARFTAEEDVQGRRRQLRLKWGFRTIVISDPERS